MNVLMHSGQVDDTTLNTLNDRFALLRENRLPIRRLEAAALRGDPIKWFQNHFSDCLALQNYLKDLSPALLDYFVSHLATVLLHPGIRVTFAIEKLEFLGAKTQILIEVNGQRINGKTNGKMFWERKFTFFV